MITFASVRAWWRALPLPLVWCVAGVLLLLAVRVVPVAAVLLGLVVVAAWLVSAAWQAVGRVCRRLRGGR